MQPTGSELDREITRGRLRLKLKACRPESSLASRASTCDTNRGGVS